MNIKPIMELVIHSNAIKYWLLLIPVKTTGSWAFLGLTKIYLAKQANKINKYIYNNTNKHSIFKLASSRPDNIIYIMYYIIEVGELLQ